MPRRELHAILLVVALAGFAIGSGAMLIRPIRVYQSLIRSVHDHFNNTCIILLHATLNPTETQELEQVDGLLALQKYLSAALNFRTAIMDFYTFGKRLGKTYYRIKRPLFVVLSDLEEVREQLASISTRIAMAYPTWLVFLRDETKFDDFFSKVYVPFDCVLLVTQRNTSGNGETIKDVYRIHPKDRLRWMTFGTWDSTFGFHGPRFGLYQRRNDLYGHNIRVVSIQDPPVSLIVRNSQNETVDLGGFFGQVVRLLREGMNCTFSYDTTDSFGVRLPNGTWTGLIRMLLDDEADLAATELVMTSDRLDVVQFTTPVYSTKCRTYIRRPESTAVKWDAYTAPFAGHVWTSIAVLIAVTSGTIAIMKAAVRKRASLPFPIDYSQSPSRLAEITFYVFGAFCSQGMQPSSLDPVRVVHLMIHLTAVVVLAAYSAALISFLAIKTYVMPFTTMQGLLEDGTYRFSVVADSADYSFFQNTSDKVLAVMFDELLKKETDLPENYMDGLRRVCSENKYAFMTLDNMAAVLEETVDCTLEPLDVIMQSTISMAVPIGSPYRGIIDSNILLLRDSGILQRLLKSEWSHQISRPKSTWTAVEIEDVMPLMLFMAAAFFLTFLLLLAERTSSRGPRDRLVTPPLDLRRFRRRF